MSSYMTYTEQSRVTGKELQDHMPQYPWGDNSMGFIGKLQLAGQSIADDNERVLGSMISDVDNLEKLPKEEVERRVREMGDKVKGDIGANIDRVMGQATEYICSLPGSQQLEALGFWQRISVKITAAFAKAFEFIAKAVRAVLAWVRDVWTSVKSFLNQAKEVFCNLFC